MLSAFHRMASQTDRSTHDTIVPHVWHLRHVGPSATVENSSSIIRLSTNGSVTVGRGPTADYYLDSQMHLRLISRVHASVTGEKLSNGHIKFVLRNFGINGSYINDFKLGTDVGNIQILHEGDKVAFGHVNSASIQVGSYAPQPQSEFQFIFEKTNRLSDGNTDLNSNPPCCKSDFDTGTQSPCKRTIAQNGYASPGSNGYISEKENKFSESQLNLNSGSAVNRSSVAVTGLPPDNSDKPIVLHGLAKPSLINDQLDVKLTSDKIYPNRAHVDDLVSLSDKDRQSQKKPPKQNTFEYDEEHCAENVPIVLSRWEDNSSKHPFKDVKSAPKIVSNISVSNDERRIPHSYQDQCMGTEHGDNLAVKENSPLCPGGRSKSVKFNSDNSDSFETVENCFTSSKKESDAGSYGVKEKTSDLVKHVDFERYEVLRNYRRVKKMGESKFILSSTETEKPIGGDDGELKHSQTGLPKRHSKSMTHQLHSHASVSNENVEKKYDSCSPTRTTSDKDHQSRICFSPKIDRSFHSPRRKECEKDHESEPTYIRAETITTPWHRDMHSGRYSDASDASPNNSPSRKRRVMQDPSPSTHSNFSPRKSSISNSPISSSRSGSTTPYVNEAALMVSSEKPCPSNSTKFYSSVSSSSMSEVSKISHASNVHSRLSSHKHHHSSESPNEENIRFPSKDSSFVPSSKDMDFISRKHGRFVPPKDGLFDSSDESSGEDGASSVNTTPCIIKKIFSPFKKDVSKTERDSKCNRIFPVPSSDKTSRRHESEDSDSDCKNLKVPHLSAEKKDCKNLKVPDLSAEKKDCKEKINNSKMSQPPDASNGDRESKDINTEWNTNRSSSSAEIAIKRSLSADSADENIESSNIIKVQLDTTHSSSLANDSKAINVKAVDLKTESTFSLSDAENMDFKMERPLTLEAMNGNSKSSATLSSSSSSSLNRNNKTVEIKTELDTKLVSSPEATDANMERNGRRSSPPAFINGNIESTVINTKIVDIVGVSQKCGETLPNLTTLKSSNTSRDRKTQLTAPSPSTLTLQSTTSHKSMSAHKLKSQSEAEVKSPPNLTELQSGHEKTLMQMKMCVVNLSSTSDPDKLSSLCSNRKSSSSKKRKSPSSSSPSSNPKTKLRKTNNKGKLTVHDDLEEIVPTHVFVSPMTSSSSASLALASESSSHPPSLFDKLLSASDKSSNCESSEVNDDSHLDSVSSEMKGIASVTTVNPKKSALKHSKELIEHSKKEAMLKISAFAKNLKHNMISKIKTPSEEPKSSSISKGHNSKTSSKEEKKKKKQSVEEGRQVPPASDAVTNSLLTSVFNRSSKYSKLKLKTDRHSKKLSLSQSIKSSSSYDTKKLNDRDTLKSNTSADSDSPLSESSTVTSRHNEQSRPPIGKYKIPRLSCESLEDNVSGSKWKSESQSKLLSNPDPSSKVVSSSSEQRSRGTIGQSLLVCKLIVEDVFKSKKENAFKSSKKGKDQKEKMLQTGSSEESLVDDDHRNHHLDKMHQIDRVSSTTDLRLLAPSLPKKGKKIKFTRSQEEPISQRN